MGRPCRIEAWWDAVEGALAAVPHAVIGGVATAKYMPQRATLDLDLAVRPPIRSGPPRP